ncbi:hypothetical protein ACHAQJ_002188 [Trichoderma viride]
MGLDSGLYENRSPYGQNEHTKPTKLSANTVDQEQTSQGCEDSDIQQLINKSVRLSPRSLPSLLLWDSVGLDLYEKITQSPDYYLTRVEADVIRINIDTIVQSIGVDGVILELGSGYADINAIGGVDL